MSEVMAQACQLDTEHINICDAQCLVSIAQLLHEFSCQIADTTLLVKGRRPVPLPDAVLEAVVGSPGKHVISAACRRE